MNTTATAPLTISPERVLADLLPKRASRTSALTQDVVLVVGFALLTALAAQIEIPLGFTPVPLTGQTFAVLLAGAALGMRRGALSQLVYWFAGLTGLPFYSGGAGGWKSGTGATLGYLVGFIVAAGAIGYLAEKKQDRNFATSLPAMLAGSAIVYMFGVAWLAHNLEVPVFNGEENAINWGLTPFIAGDLVKLAFAGLLTPLAWKLVDKKA